MSSFTEVFARSKPKAFEVQVSRKFLSPFVSLRSLSLSLINLSSKFSVEESTFKVLVLLEVLRAVVGTCSIMLKPVTLE